MNRIPAPAIASVAIPSLGALTACITGWYSLAIVLILAALLLLCLVWLDYGPGSGSDPGLTAIADATREPRPPHTDIDGQVAAFAKELQDL